MKDEFKEIFEVLNNLPKEDDYKRVISEAIDEYGTLKESHVNELFSIKDRVKHFIKFKLVNKNKIEDRKEVGRYD